jgi:hypothetical protein
MHREKLGHAGSLVDLVFDDKSPPSSWHHSHFFQQIEQLLSFVDGYAILTGLDH